MGIRVLQKLLTGVPLRRVLFQTASEEVVELLVLRLYGFCFQLFSVERIRYFLCLPSVVLESG